MKLFDHTPTLFTVYLKSTGRIVRQGRCAADTVHLQAVYADEAVHVGDETNDEKHRIEIVDGKSVVKPL